MIKARLINIGRNQVTREVEVKKREDLVGEVSKHLLSREVGLHPDSDNPNYYTVFAGFRTVGRVEII